ncbi:hypothetical protein KP806_04870 [Paenibacillus sp. N4]|uniref:hypothetical protein n=1 Tax=Paenibacillus vietnamensis TaxID=2590547 RepID=UPI001CD13382|nr:hypothetical protein [Paenibacillus vietnamensis]MCA0754371.1 hypothetical protein [Paenibacillus vietnamensis]
MMRPRVIPVLITAAITASVLFGGWAIYNQVAIAAPLDKVVNDVDGVISSGKPVMTKDNVVIDVVLDPDANVRAVYEAIAANGSGVFGDRKLELNIETKSDKQLDDIWSKALFQVAEAMETKTYSNIPGAVKEAAAGSVDVSVSTEMDDNNVYVTLKNGDTVKYIVLPRNPAMLEVW